jgi:hypothetical protein
VNLSRIFQKILWLVLSFQIYLFYLFSKVEPDPYHDGFIYAPAVAVADGLLPNRDFFAQYGPISPLIQGTWLWITSPTILNLKILNCIFVAGISIILVQILKKRLRTELAQLISIAWVSWFAASMPWPSVITTLFTLVAFGSLLNSKNSGKIRLVLAAVCLVLAVFTRIQTFLFLLALIPIYCFEKDFEKRKVYRLFLLASFVSFVVGVLAMSSLGILDHYIQQSIVWASQAYSEVEISKSFLTSFVWFPISFLALLLIVFSIRWMRTKDAFGIFIFSLLTLVLFGLNQIEINGNVSLSNPQVLVVYATRSILHLTGYASAFSVVILSSYWLVRSNGFKNLKSAPLLALLWGLLALGQLWPLHDDIHVWFITPLLIVATIFALPNKSFDKLNLTKPVAILLMSILFVNSLQNIKFLSIERSPYKNFSMAGLFGDSKKVYLVDTSMDYLQSARLLGTYRNQCTHGLYAIVGGKYAVSDGAFAANSRTEYVNWYPTGIENQTSVFFNFYCGLSRDHYSKIADSQQLLYVVGNERDLQRSDSFNVLYRGTLPQN